MDTQLDASGIGALADGIRHGDERAFRSLFEALYSPLVSYSAGLCRDRRAAEDFAQEAFVRLWRNRALLDPRRSIRALLYTTVRNLSLNEMRQRSTRNRLLKNMERTNCDHDAAAGYDVERLRERLRAWIDQLPEREQEAFRLSRFADLTHQEIADVMGISKGTVEKHVTNALKKLRDRLKAYDPELLKS